MYNFILAEWRNDRQDIRSVREQVLCDELDVNWEFGEPEREEHAFHVLVYDEAGRAVGAARMQPEGRIDYIAVRRPWRGVTVGGALLTYLLHIAQVRRLGTVWSVVPPGARRFFEKNGFVPASDDTESTAVGCKLVRMVPLPGAWKTAAH